MSKLRTCPVWRMVEAIRSINAFSVVCEFATVQRFGLYDIAPTVAFTEQLPTGRSKQCVLNCNSDGKELSTFFSKMDSSWIDNIFWCLQIGLFFLNGECYSTCTTESLLVSQNE